MRAGLLLGLIFLFPFVHTSPISATELNETTPTRTPLEEYKARFMKWIVPEKSHEISLETGQVHGKEAKVGNVSAKVFNSIPYAKPPTGEGRFENPEPMDDWNGTKDTTMFIECMHTTDPPLPALNYSEDCLYLKAVMPVDKTLEENRMRHPAVFWIHGGGHTYGSKENFELENIVKHFTSKNIVFIAPNYRLGMLGFFRTTMNDSETGNYGLEDLILALKFVHENADVFHVDVNQITIAGDGSGAALASLLALSPRAKGLFSSVILSSGTSLAKDSVRSDPTMLGSTYLWFQCCERGSGSAYPKECLKKLTLNCMDQHFKSLIPHKGKQTKNFKTTFAMISSRLTPVVDSYRGNDSIIPSENLSDLVLENSHVPILLTGVPHEFNGSQEYLEKADMFAAAQYEEALSYAKNGMDVYYIRNNVRKLATEYTTSGMDTSLIFGNLESAELKPIAKDAEKWITSYVNILTEFIRTRKVSSLLPFATNERNAYSVSNNGTEKFIYKSGNYNFWKSMTVQKPNTPKL